METTFDLDDNLMAEAMRVTGIQEKTAVVRLGLEALISREASRRLAAMGGTMPDLKSIPRRRSVPAEDDA